MGTCISHILCSKAGLLLVFLGKYIRAPRASILLKESSVQELLDYQKNVSLGSSCACSQQPLLHDIVNQWQAYFLALLLTDYCSRCTNGSAFFHENWREKHENKEK